MPTEHAATRGSAAAAKFGITVAVILAGMLIPARHWPAHAALAVLIFAAQSFAGIPLRYLARRLALFLPVLGLFALSLPMSQGWERGGPMAATIFLRGLVAFLATLWLVAVLPFPELLQTLRRFHCPALLVALLAFMHRFSFLLMEEIERMRRARQSRLGGGGGLWMRWKMGGQLIGMLLIRAMRRSDRVHQAMCARGWDGHVRTWDE